MRWEAEKILLTGFIIFYHGLELMAELLGNLESC